MQAEELDSNDLVNMCIQGDKESLQEYMHRVVKLTTQAPGVSESSIIDTIMGALKVGTCQKVNNVSTHTNPNQNKGSGGHKGGH
jgi:hypothetical protein